METRDLINKMIQTEGRIQHCPFCHGTITNIASEQITHTADCVWYEIRVKLDEIVKPIFIPAGSFDKELYKAEANKLNPDYEKNIVKALEKCAVDKSQWRTEELEKFKMMGPGPIFKHEYPACLAEYEKSVEDALEESENKSYLGLMKERIEELKEEQERIRLWQAVRDRKERMNKAIESQMDKSSEELSPYSPTALRQAIEMVNRKVEENRWRVDSLEKIVNMPTVNSSYDMYNLYSSEHLEWLKENAKAEEDAAIRRALGIKFRDELVEPKPKRKLYKPFSGKLKPEE